MKNRPEEEIICVATQQGGAEIMFDKCPTITASAGMSGNNQPIVCKPKFDRGGQKQAYCIGNGQVHDLYMTEYCRCLNCMDDPMKVIVSKCKETE